MTQSLQKELFVLRSKENKAYMVDLNGCRKLPVYCNMDGAGLGDCGGGGWTLVMKINGAKVSTKLILLVGLTSYIVRLSYHQYGYIRKIAVAFK